MEPAVVNEVAPIERVARTMYLSIDVNRIKCTLVVYSSHYG